MAENIIGKMFDVDPDQMQAQRMQNIYNQSMQMAQLDPFQRASTGIMQGMAGATMLGAKALGLKTREEQLAETRQAALQGLNSDDPQSVLAAAQRLNEAGDTRGAMMLTQHAREVEKAKVEENYKIAQTSLAEAKAKDLAKEEALKVPQPKIEEIGVEGGMFQKAIIKPDGTITPVGKPYQKGSEREDKASKDAAKMTLGQKQLTSITDQLREHYNELNKMSAIVSTSRAPADNIAARAMLTPAGQAAAGTVGSKVQTRLNAIKGLRPALVSAMKSATGKSAAEMNSDRDIRLALDQATDPTFGYEANMMQLDFLNKTYGLGLDTGSSQPQQPVIEEWVRVNGKLQRKQ